MHLGRDFPYHPTYWATECCFWPAFVPWKIVGLIEFRLAGAWSILQTPFGEVSDAGTLNDDGTVITYHWSLDDSAPATDLTLSIAKAYFSSVPYARFQWTLLDGTDVITSAYDWEPFPLVEWSPGSYEASDFDTPFPPPPPPYPLAMSFKPARYALGGTPYPNA
jgi:hypothetical protein